MLLDNTFVNNTADYGAEIAGYPIQIVLVSELLSEYVSGQNIEKDIVFKLIDGYGETIKTDSESVLTISAVD